MHASMQTQGTVSMHRMTRHEFDAFPGTEAKQPPLFLGGDPYWAKSWCSDDEKFDVHCYTDEPPIVQQGPDAEVK